MVNVASEMLVRFTKQELKAIIRLKDLHVKFHHGGGLTRHEVVEYEKLKKSLMKVLPVEY